MKTTESGQKCGWCGAPLPCGCGYNKTDMGKVDWKRVEQVFGKKGMPSCGMTDAGRLNSADPEAQSPDTVYIGGSSDSEGK